MTQSKLLKNEALMPVDSELVSLAIDKTEGWPAGLQLVAIALAHSDNIEQLLNSFNGKIQEVGEFLAEDVLEKLDPSMTDFLIKTSILKRFSVPLCNAITGRNDSRTVINELERQSLFILSLDGEQKWYRYQSIFSDFLLRNLTENFPNVISSLYIKASHWFVNEGLYVQGVQYAITGENFNLAAKILDNHAEGLLRRGLFDTLYRLVVRLPIEVLTTFPNLLLWKASYLICNRKFYEAQPILKQVEIYLASEKNVVNYDTDTMQSLRSTLLRSRLMLSQFMDDMPSLERICLKVFI